MATFRFIAGAGQDKTGRVATYSQSLVAYATPTAVKPTEFRNLVQVGQLTGALTLTAATTLSNIGDTLVFMFSADGTNRVVTFSTGFAVTGTLTVTASKLATASFVFNGTSWVEVSRAVTV
jgi:hypothetical protein